MTKPRIFVGDFETSVYDGQTETEVWASALVEVGTEKVTVDNCIEDTWERLTTLARTSNLVVYYHNLKFDGHFWLSFLLKDLKMRQALKKTGTGETEVEWLPQKYMNNNSLRYSISDMGQWYTITIKVNNHIIEFRDSYKLLPFSVATIGESFGTHHKKTIIEYKGERHAHETITELEEEYIKNDVLVVSEALDIMFEDGHNKLTIGACCLHEFKRCYDKQDYANFFPDLTKLPIDKNVYGASDVDEYVRKSYGGGWCYVVKGKENKVYGKGVTADVNSLYPSVMHSESGNRYPVGKPKFWKGNFIPDEALRDNIYYFVRVRTRFYIKENKLPFIHIRGNRFYHGNDNLETSDIYDEDAKQYYSVIVKDGEITDTHVTLTLTMTDYNLIMDHYDLIDFEILDGCYFYSYLGLFDEYINKYAEIKKNNKGALRTEAKLFLNNLYGKLASSSDSSFKVAYVKDDESLGFYSIKENNKQSGFIACGSAITSYARNFTIRHAQLNYYGADKKGFIYADTDSIHCDLEPEELRGIKVHPYNFNAWKLEAYWDEAIFARQKTYIEHVTHEDGEAVEPYYNIKCAGMPKRCKELFATSLCGTQDNEKNSYTKEEQDFLFNKGEKIRRNIADFKIGLSVPSKLLPKRVKGGLILQDTTFCMR